MPYRLEKLPSTEAETFAAFQYSVSGGSTPIERLQRDTMYVFRNRSGDICSCFVAGTKPPFRSLEATVPLAERPRVETRFDPNDVVDMYGFGTAETHRKRFASTVFWLLGLVAVFTHGKRQIIAGTVEPRLRRFYDIGDPREIFSGQMVYNGATKDTWLLCWDRWKLARSMCLAACKRVADNMTGRRFMLRHY